ncbi:MFS transporter [Tengunoibacter tsumagoiensis]|uniref:Multidrug efflux pump Tap n=1 Tax=Tengunoibacter tsumagoiensis TaxID=2014871 RepID=A0A402A6W9_9CHLR|nr:MFS transporter [Tengunoibacter tsumagoiensis]GCE14775.1 MFS transporter [Tengunoibacter tsumagoiensis]
METQTIPSVLPPRRLPLLAFFAANLISFVGDRLTLLAIPWFVLQTTGSITKTGITAFFTTLPTIISAFLSGLIVDRLGYKRTSVIGDCASGVCTLLIPLLFHTLGLAFWQLLILAFLGGLLKAPGETARSSLLPELGQASQMRMERVNAVGDGLVRVSGLLGAPLAALLIVAIGANNLLWLDAISFFLSALLIGIAVPATMAVPTHAESGDNTGSLKQGLSFLLHNPVLRSMIPVSLTTNLLDAALFSVALPVYANQIWQNILPIGLLSATFGGCAFVSTLLFGFFGHRLPRRLTYGLCFMAIGLRFWALGLQVPLPILFVIYAFSGLVVGPLNPIAMTIEQEIIPPKLRARVLGVAGAGYLGGIPIGGLLCGYVITWIGLIPTLFTMGLIYLLVTGSLLINPALKGMNRSISLSSSQS